MNWDAIGAVGEIVGALAVFGSLIYLAIQIRVSNKASRNALHQEVMGQTFLTISQISSTTESSELWMKGLSGDSSLSEAEITRFGMYLSQSVYAWERVYFLAKEGEINDYLSDQYAHVRSRVAATPGFLCWYRARHDILSEEFQSVLEKDMKNGETFKPLVMSNASGT